jgi:ribosome-associated protein
MAETLRIDGTCVIPLDEIEWRYDTSSGPGGQHANRARTRVEASFDVAGSPSLTDRQRALLLTRIGPVARAASGDERSQTRNREVALARLRQRLADGLHQERPRRATKPSSGAKERRLDSKRRRGDIKRDRGRRDYGD